jgi:hypothetical protein
MPIRYRDNKPPVYVCDDCGLAYTHDDNHMLILRDDVWLKIASKKTCLCDVCIAQRLQRPVMIEDLWVNNKGNISEINKWWFRKNYIIITP